MSVLHTFFMVPKNGSTSCEERHEHMFPKCQHKSTSKPSQLHGALLFSSVSRLVAGKLDMHCHGRGIGGKGQCQEICCLLHALKYLLIHVLIHIMLYIYSFVYRQCVCLIKTYQNDNWVQVFDAFGPISETGSNWFLSRWFTDVIINHIEIIDHDRYMCIIAYSQNIYIYTTSFER